MLSVRDVSCAVFELLMAARSSGRSAVVHSTARYEEQLQLSSAQTWTSMQLSWAELADINLSRRRRPSSISAPPSSLSLPQQHQHHQHTQTSTNTTCAPPPADPDVHIFLDVAQINAQSGRKRVSDCV